jgi:hypothetical protein
MYMKQLEVMEKLVCLTILQLATTSTMPAVIRDKGWPTSLIKLKN